MEKLTSEFKIEYIKGDTYALAIKFKNITEDLRTAYLSVKENPDDEPLIQKSLGAGIDKIEDRSYKNEKTYKFQLQPADTVNLEAKVPYLYDIQVTVGNVVKTVLHGVFLLGSTITGTSVVTTQEMEVAIDDELETELLTTPATNGVEYEQDPVACAKIGDLTTLETTNKDTVAKAVNEVNKQAKTNAEDINKMKNGEIELPSAKNVSETINGKNISDIFEDDGLTSKNATNLTGQINGKNITDIFEDDGLTSKNATNSKQAENSSKINNIEITQDENGVIKNGNNIISQKVFLKSGTITTTANTFYSDGKLLGRKFKLVIFLKGTASTTYPTIHEVESRMFSFTSFWGVDGEPDIASTSSEGYFTGRYMEDFKFQNHVGTEYTATVMVMLALSNKGTEMRVYLKDDTCGSLVCNLYEIFE